MPAAQPWTWQTTGVCVVSSSSISRCASVGRRRWMLPTRGRSSPALRPTMSKPAQKWSPAPREHDDADRLVGSRRRERVDHGRPRSGPSSALRFSGRSISSASTGPSCCTSQPLDRAVGISARSRRSSADVPLADGGRGPPAGRGRRPADRAGAPGRARGSAAGSVAWPGVVCSPALVHGGELEVDGRALTLGQIVVASPSPTATACRPRS